MQGYVYPTADAPHRVRVYALAYNSAGKLVTPSRVRCIAAKTAR